MPIKVIHNKNEAIQCLNEMRTYLKVIYTEFTNIMSNANGNVEFQLMKAFKFGKFTNIPYSTSGNDISMYEIVNHVFGYIVTFKACIELFDLYGVNNNFSLTCNLAQSSGLDIYSSVFTDNLGNSKQIACEIFTSTNEGHNNKLNKEVFALENNTKINQPNNIIVASNQVDKYVFLYLPSDNFYSQEYKSLKLYPKTTVYMKWLDIH